MAGYSGTPLPKKLGIEAGHKVCLLNAPRSFERKVYAAEDVRVAHDLRMPPVDIVVLFVMSVAELERRVSDIAFRLHPAGGLWVAFPRRGTDITLDMVARIAMAAGMVHNKACSIGEGHLGIRLVNRLENRDAMAYRAAPPPPPAISRRTRRPTAPARMATRTSSGAGSSMRRARARSTK